MTALTPIPVLRLYDNSGNLAIGAQVFTYQAGTSTPQATYTDSSQTTPNANPVIANSRGEVVMWLGTGLSYKIIAKDSQNNLLWTVDNITGADYAAGNVSAALMAYEASIANTSDPAQGDALVGVKQPFAGAVSRTQHEKNIDIISVKDFGAVGDGVADDTEAIQAAIDANLNGTVFFPAGAYKITDTLSVKYSLSTGKNSTSLKGVGLGATLLWDGPDNKSVFWYEATTVNAGTFAKTVIEGLFFKNDGGANGLIGIRLGNFAGPLTSGAGIANVTIRNNKFDNFDIGVQLEYESDGVSIEDNVFSEYNVYGVYNVGSARFKVIGNYFQFGNPGSLAVYSEYSTITITDNLIQSSDSGVVGGVQLKNVSGFEIARNYIELPYTGIQFAILLTNSRCGYIGSNVIQGFQGTDCIYIDGTSAQVNIGPNAFGFFGTAPNSLIRTLPGAADINVLGHQRFDGGAPPATPVMGTGYNFGWDSTYMLLGVGAYTGTPNPGVTASATGVLNIGNNAAATGWAFQSFSRSGVSIGSITQSGTTAVAYNTSSDYRLKQNVQPMTGALAKLAQLKPCTYTWKSDGSHGEGFIAHELAEVVPQCVTGAKDAVDEEGRPIYQGIDTSFLVATLAAAIKEQQTLIQQLQADVAALKTH